MKPTEELPLQKMDAQPVASAQMASAARTSFDIEATFRYAIEKGAGPEAMTTLMNIRRELNAEAAKKAFDEALSAFQDECPVIVKTRSVPTRSGDTAYKYAPIEQIEEKIRPIERKHGFNHTFDTDVSSQPGFVIAACIVTHVAGHERRTSIKLPLGVKTNIMSDTQVYAGALTFANRRALANAYGLVIAGEDKDGAEGKSRPAGPAMAQSATSTESTIEVREKLWKLCKQHDGTLTAERTWGAIKVFLRTKDILRVEEDFDKVGIARLQEILAATEKHFNG